MATVLFDDTGNPVTVEEVSGQRLIGTKARATLYDASGNPMAVEGGSAIPAGTKSFLVAGKDDSTARCLAVDSSGRLQVWVAGNIASELPTFRVVFDRITMDSGKHLATLFNTSSIRKVVLQRFWVFNWQLSHVTGNECDLGWYRISARTAGTSMTITPEDTSDILSSGISADTNSTSVTVGSLLTRVMFSGEELDFSSGEVYNLMALPNTALRYDRREGQRGLTLRQNQGVSLRFDSGDTSGTVSVIYEFTDEAA